MYIKLFTDKYNTIYLFRLYFPIRNNIKILSFLIKLNNVYIEHNKIV